MFSAHPVDGKANEEILRFVAEHFGLHRKSVVLLSGEKSRQKKILLRGQSVKNIRLMVK